MKEKLHTQLKQLEQECEQLKKDCCNSILGWEKENTALQKQVDELKRDVGFYKTTLDFQRDISDTYYNKYGAIGTTKDGQIRLAQLLSEKQILVEALEKIVNNDYDIAGLYDDDFEEQRDRLIEIAKKTIERVNP